MELKKNVVSFVLFIKREQDKLLKQKVPYADTAMVIKDVSQTEFRNYFNSDDIIKWEEKD